LILSRVMTRGPGCSMLNLVHDARSRRTNLVESRLSNADGPTGAGTVESASLFPPVIRSPTLRSKASRAGVRTNSPAMTRMVDGPGSGRDQGLIFEGVAGPGPPCLSAPWRHRSRRPGTGSVPADFLFRRRAGREETDLGVRLGPLGVPRERCATWFGGGDVQGRPFGCASRFSSRILRLEHGRAARRPGGGGGTARGR